MDGLSVIEFPIDNFVLVSQTEFSLLVFGRTLSVILNIFLFQKNRLGNCCGQMASFENVMLGSVTAIVNLVTTLHEKIVIQSVKNSVVLC
jgi:hypothetical protein